MTTARFTKENTTIVVSAINDSGIGFLNNLVNRGDYSQAECFDLAMEYHRKYIMIDTLITTDLYGQPVIIDLKANREQEEQS